MTEELIQFLNTHAREWTEHSNGIFVSSSSVFNMLNLANRLKSFGYIVDPSIGIKVIPTTGVCGTKFIKG